MSGSPATGLAHSVQVRLKNAATLAGRPFVELVELYDVERLLHRLRRSPQRGRFVLKGALLLRQWLSAQSRPTRDTKDGRAGLVGNEINVNRYFYRYTPPRPLEVIERENRGNEPDSHSHGAAGHRCVGGPSGSKP